MSVFSALLPSLQTTLTEQGITRPTEVQSESLPSLLAGKSLVGVAETGSGKTLAFVLPLLHQLKTLELEGSSVSSKGCPRGLVLVPGRELGDQVSRVFKGLTHGTRVRVRTALGGSKKAVARQNVGGQFEVLVATPGRLRQLMEDGGLRLSDVRTLVFDEADQMLDPGFVDEARSILAKCPSKVQLVLFSATLPASLETAVKGLFPSPPVRVRTHGSQRLVPTLSTQNRTVVHGDRATALREVLNSGPMVSSILFSNTRKQCAQVAEWLDEAGVAYTTCAGEMNRAERKNNLKRFRTGEVALLLTTDLGGRGLDIERVERIINVFLPRELDNYLHRAGRTARAGRAGLMVNLVTERDEPLLTKVAKRLT